MLFSPLWRIVLLVNLSVSKFETPVFLLLFIIRKVDNGNAMTYPIPDLEDFLGFNQGVTGMEQECKGGPTGVLNLGDTWV